jgi:serine/threonine-protein kinase RsbW
MSLCDQRMKVPHGPEHLSRARRWLSEALAPLHLPQPTVEALTVALSEATTNAMVHGGREQERPPIELHCWLEPERLVIEVESEGEPFVPEEIRLPEVTDWHPRGRGLFLMQQLVDHLEFLPRERGVRVRLIKQLPAPC